jgi:hypothetical protein
MSVEVRRPGVVTFIGVIIYIQAVLNLVGAVALFLSRDDRSLNEIGISSDELLWGSIGMAAFAVLLFFVGAGILGGSRGARLFVAIVTGWNMAAAVWGMFYFHQAGFVVAGLVPILIGLFVLWALYGHERSEEFFERRIASSSAGLTQR